MLYLLLVTAVTLATCQVRWFQNTLKSYFIWKHIWSVLLSSTLGSLHRGMSRGSVCHRCTQERELTVRLWARQERPPDGLDESRSLTGRINPPHTHGEERESKVIKKKEAWKREVLNTWSREKVSASERRGEHFREASFRQRVLCHTKTTTSSTSTSETENQLFVQKQGAFFSVYILRKVLEFVCVCVCVGCKQWDKLLESVALTLLTHMFICFRLEMKFDSVCRCSVTELNGSVQPTSVRTCQVLFACNYF